MLGEFPDLSFLLNSLAVPVYCQFYRQEQGGNCSYNDNLNRYHLSCDRNYIAKSNAAYNLQYIYLFAFIITAGLIKFLSAILWRKCEKKVCRGIIKYQRLIINGTYFTDISENMAVIISTVELHRFEQSHRNYTKLCCIIIHLITPGLKRSLKFPNIQKNTFPSHVSTVILNLDD